jgi:hypothetical protein
MLIVAERENLLKTVGERETCNQWVRGRPADTG